MQRNRGTRGVRPAQCTERRARDHAVRTAHRARSSVRLPPGRRAAVRHSPITPLFRSEAAEESHADARPSKLLMTTAAVIAVADGRGGCEAKVYGTPAGAPRRAAADGRRPAGHHALALPEAPPTRPSAAFAGLADRERRPPPRPRPRSAPTSSVAVLDRNTASWSPTATAPTIATASVVKLFIADDLLLQGPRARPNCRPSDRKSLDVMLRSSDDGAAETFWNRSGGSAIIAGWRPATGWSSTAPPGNGRWLNTISTATDLVRYYDMLLDGLRRAAAGAGQHHPVQPGRVDTHSARRHVPTATRSGSASPRACTPNRWRSSRAGCAASAPTGCTCRPV